MDLSSSRLIYFIKNEAVFSISAVLAVISSLFVKPSLSYINYQTILLLFIIILMVEVLKNLSIFEILVHKLVTKITTSRSIVLFLIFTCFFSSIFITNDVSLIVFVPFTILTLKKINKTNLIIFTVVLETIAANVGCMLLPIGAPHNIVLYTISGIGFSSFIMVLLPYIIVSVVTLFCLTFFVSKDKIQLELAEEINFNRKNFLKKVFYGVDYYLLLTFVALFILIGNLENIHSINILLRSVIIGNEVIGGILLSQVISNVPSAMLLANFSTNYEQIIIGINLGGFGTLIASMANLISYKILIKEFKEFKIKYLIEFTVLNIVFLIILLGVYFLSI